MHLLDEVASTNAVAIDLAREGGDHGLVVVTEHQTAGRGRLDRRWEAPPRSSLMFSVVLRPQMSIEHWPWLPLLTGHAVRQALSSHGIEATVKWPNDVLLDELKVAGILVERVETDRGAAAIIGIGLNVSMTEDELPVPTATSILLSTGQVPDRDDLLVALVRQLITAYAEWAPDPARPPASGALRTAYSSVCSTLGRAVRAELPDGHSIVGEAVAVDRGGRLVLRTEQGERAIGAGDVVHIRPDE